MQADEIVRSRKFFISSCHEEQQQWRFRVLHQQPQFISQVETVCSSKFFISQVEQQRAKDGR